MSDHPGSTHNSVTDSRAAATSPSSARNKASKKLSSEVQAARAEHNHISPALLPSHPSSFHFDFPNLDFPTLNKDGSLSDLTAHQSREHSTVPAALSTLSARNNMGNPAAESGASLADSSYDMLDDLSEISNDNHSTISSVASEEEAQDSEQEESAAYQRRGSSSEDEDNLLSFREDTSASTDASFITIPRPRMIAANPQLSRLQQNQIENELIDSYMSEDLETPRQSCMKPVKSNSVRAHAATVADCPSRSKSKESAFRESALSRWLHVIVFLVLTIVFYTPPGLEYLASWRLASRRNALIDSLGAATGSANGTRHVNIEHLLRPGSTLFRLSDHQIDQSEAKSQRQPHSDVILPNHFVLSLPCGLFCPQVMSYDVSRPGQLILDANLTRLIDGVYLVSFDEAQAYGTVSLNLKTSKPAYNISVPGNFGFASTTGSTSTTGTDLTRAACKEVAVLRKRVRDMGAKLVAELSASKSATQNLTTQFAEQVSRELAVVGSSAVATFHEAAQVLKGNLPTIDRNPVVTRKDLVIYIHDFRSSFKAKVHGQNGSRPRSYLARSRERMQGILKAYQQGRERRNKERSDALLEKVVESKKHVQEHSRGIYRYSRDLEDKLSEARSVAEARAIGAPNEDKLRTCEAAS